MLDDVSLGAASSTVAGIGIATLLYVLALLGLKF